jgi:hypothetical protein
MPMCFGLFYKSESRESLRDGVCWGAALSQCSGTRMNDRDRIAIGVDELKSRIGLTQLRKRHFRGPDLPPELSYENERYIRR